MERRSGCGMEDAAGKMLEGEYDSLLFANTSISEDFLSKSSEK
jgi:hypothetical protein